MVQKYKGQNNIDIELQHKIDIKTQQQSDINDYSKLRVAKKCNHTSSALK